MKHPHTGKMCDFRWDSNPCLSHSGLVYFFHSISYLEAIFVLKIHKFVFVQEELLEITSKSMHLGWWTC